MNIVQIGCYKGQDHVQAFITEHYSVIQKAILIDGNKNYVELCREAYNDLPKVKVLHYAIVTDDRTTVTFYVSETTPEECTTSIDFINSSCFKDTYTAIETPAINLTTLFKQHELTHIDRLYIDAEGMDVDIVNSIDFNKVQIQYLYFEHLHAEGTRLTGNGVKFQNCINKLTDQGYQIQTIGWDIVATK